MTIKTFLAGIAAATVICFAAWFAVVGYIDPDTAGWASLTLFYFSLFLWIGGFFILAGFCLRRIFMPRGAPYALLAAAMRQAILAAAGIDVFLILKSAHMFNWINGTFLAISIIFTEIYFLSSPRSKNYK